MNDNFFYESNKYTTHARNEFNFTLLLNWTNYRASYNAKLEKY